MTWVTAPHILETIDIETVYTDAHEPIVTLDNGATALVFYVVVREDSAKHPAVADAPAYLALPEMPARLLHIGEAFIVDEYHAPSTAVPVSDGDPALAAAPEVPAPAPVVVASFTAPSDPVALAQFAATAAPEAAPEDEPEAEATEPEEATETEA